MLQVNRIKTDIKPETFEYLNNGIYYYNYDIQETIEPNSNGEDTTFYSFVQVRIPGKPTYDSCVRAIIRAYIDSNSEFDLINSYNAYQLAIDSDMSDYEDYLQLIKEIKYKVRNDFQDTTKPSIVSNKARMVDICNLLCMTINTMSLTDQQSLSVKSLYPNWEDLIGQTLTVGTKLQYGNKLFKVVQQHTAQREWIPGIDTASLYTEIVEDHQGTLEDPIPYPEDGNMIIYSGKYYIENGVIYQCIRDSGQPLYTSLSNVVDNYVKIVETLS